MNYRLFFLLTLLICSGTLFSQTDNWFVLQSEAITYAEENEAKVIMIFAGSDWCRPCIQFKQDILESEAFSNFSPGKLAILYLDFPSKKKNRLSEELTSHNEELAELYNSSGIFPKIIVFNKEMTKLQELAFKGQTPQEFIDLLL